ncbi:MAG: porin [Candidatus Electrothrix sp. AR4]|nr:porin [Candidatus Electrothrix sp. AR4]
MLLNLFQRRTVMRKKQKSTCKITVITAAILLSGVSEASSLEVKSGNDNVNVNLYGQINRAVMFADDGNEQKLFHVDNDNSSTRLGLNGKVAANESLTVGGKFEVEWQANPSNKVSMEEESISGSFNERHMDLYFTLKDIGKLSIGRGDMASNGSSEVDLSGTTVAGFSELDIGRGFAFYDTSGIAVSAEDGAQAAARAGYVGITVNNVFSSMDGLSRRNRVRYDTPTFAGFTVGVAAGEEERSDLALRYSNRFGGTKLQAAVAYSNPGERSDYSQVNGSTSVLFGFGLNLTLAVGVRDMDDIPVNGENPAFTYSKIGYKMDLISAGSTAFSFDYGIYENIGTMDAEQEGTLMGVQFVQKFSTYSSELFVAYRNWEVEDKSGAEYEPISIMLAGARIKF